MIGFLIILRLLLLAASIQRHRNLNVYFLISSPVSRKLHLMKLLSSQLCVIVDITTHASPMKTPKEISPHGLNIVMAINNSSLVLEP